jgi:alanine racemase
MARRCTASINLNAIKKNYLYAKSLSPNAKAIAIVKANAYGHGAIKVANHLEDCADCYGVSCTEEAIELRNSGIDKTPILLMEGVFEVSELKLIEKYNLIVTVCNSKQLGWLLDNKFNESVDVFVKYDSGMGRLGFQGEEFINAINLLEESEKIGQITLMTHFSSADDLNSTTTNEQISNFDKTLYSKKYSTSLANSAAIMSWSESHREYTRPGIMLYGSSPFPEKNFLNKLTPAMTLSSVLISIKSLKAGQSIGYGCRYICKQDTLIGVVAIGYADGYPRSAEDGTPVYINGVKSKIAGRVSMDMITIDLTGVPNPQIGDCVELFGENISIDEVAEHCSTISYEIFTKITNRVYKSYV